MYDSIEARSSVKFAVRRSQNLSESHFSFRQRTISFKEAKILFGERKIFFERAKIPFGEQIVKRKACLNVFETASFACRF